jgi:hypothetical protein
MSKELPDFMIPNSEKLVFALLSFSSHLYLLENPARFQPDSKNVQLLNLMAYCRGQP